MPAYLKPLGKGRPVLLDKPILFVGRHPECDIILLNSRKVSRKHCCIAQINDHYSVRDLGSTNGITVNGTRVRKEAEFNIGDEVIIGDVSYQLLSGVAPKNAKLASQRDNRADDDAIENDDAMAQEEVDAIIETAEPLSDNDVVADGSIEMSQEFPVVIDDDEPISISKLSARKKPPVPEEEKFDEDSNAEVMILDESQYFYEDDDED